MLVYIQNQFMNEKELSAVGGVRPNPLAVQQDGEY
jgi:hypothetical protein